MHQLPSARFHVSEPWLPQVHLDQKRTHFFAFPLMNKYVIISAPSLLPILIHYLILLILSSWFLGKLTSFFLLLLLCLRSGQSEWPPNLPDYSKNICHVWITLTLPLWVEPNLSFAALQFEIHYDFTLIHFSDLTSIFYETPVIDTRTINISYHRTSVPTVLGAILMPYFPRWPLFFLQCYPNSLAPLFLFVFIFDRNSLRDYYFYSLRILVSFWLLNTPITLLEVRIEETMVIGS